MKDLRQAVERVHWDTIKADCKLPDEDNNDDFVYGLHLYDDTQGEDFVDIVDNQWFKTEEEREAYIIEWNLRVIFE